MQKIVEKKKFIMCMIDLQSMQFHHPSEFVRANSDYAGWDPESIFNGSDGIKGRTRKFNQSTNLTIL